MSGLQESRMRVTELLEHVNKKSALLCHKGGMRLTCYLMTKVENF